MPFLELDGYQEASLSRSFNIFRVFTFLFTKIQGSPVSVACFFVPGVNLGFSCLMDRVAKSRKRAINADGARLWKRMAGGWASLGIKFHINRKK